MTNTLPGNTYQVIARYFPEENKLNMLFFVTSASGTSMRNLGYKNIKEVAYLGLKVAVLEVMGGGREREREQLFLHSLLL